jgi:hypothetical protein
MFLFNFIVGDYAKNLEQMSWILSLFIFKVLKQTF